MITPVQEQEFPQSNGPDSPTFTADDDFTPGNAVFFALSMYPFPPTAVSIGGVTATKIAESATNDVCQIWTANGAFVGDEIQVTNDSMGNGTFMNAGMVELEGEWSLDVFDDNLGTGTTPEATTADTEEAGEFAIACWSNGSNSTGGTVPGGWTVLYTAGAEMSEGGGGAWVQTGGVGPVHPVFTNVGSINWGCVVAAFKQEQSSTPNALFFGAQASM